MYPQFSMDFVVCIHIVFKCHTYLPARSVTIFKQPYFIYHFTLPSSIAYTPRFQRAYSHVHPSHSNDWESQVQLGTDWLAWWCDPEQASLPNSLFHCATASAIRVWYTSLLPVQEYIRQLQKTPHAFPTFIMTGSSQQCLHLCTSSDVLIHLSSRNGCDSGLSYGRLFAVLYLESTWVCEVDNIH